MGFGTDFDLAKVLSWGSTGDELKTQDHQRRKVSGTPTGLTPAQEKQSQGLEKKQFFSSASQGLGTKQAPTVLEED